MLSRIVVFASGTGSNYKKIKESIDNKKINGKIVLLISNNPNCEAVKFSRLNNIDYEIINDYRYKDEKNKNNQYQLVLKTYKTDLILLAGFMKKIPDNIIKIYKNKIMNIHPSLLPEYGGKGYYGSNVHNAVIKNRNKFTGATVHFVDENYDKGPIVMQKKIKINSLDTSESISKKVLKIEHEIYSKAVEAFCSKKIIINESKVIINE